MNCYFTVYSRERCTRNKVPQVIKTDYRKTQRAALWIHQRCSLSASAKNSSGTTGAQALAARRVSDPTMTAGKKAAKEKLLEAKRVRGLKDHFIATAVSMAKKVETEIARMQEYLKGMEATMHFHMDMVSEAKMFL